MILGPLKDGDVATTPFGDDVFPEVFKGKVIGPGVTVTGFIFLEGPQHGFEGSIRCRIRDATDNDFIELVGPSKEQNYLNTPLPLSERGIGIKETEDIKNYPVVPWSHEWR